MPDAQNESERFERAHRLIDAQDVAGLRAELESSPEVVGETGGPNANNLLGMATATCDERQVELLLTHGADSRRARRVVDELGDLLAELLSERSRWPDATEDFLALVTVTGKRHEAQLESLALARAKRAAGSDRVGAFLEAATSTLSARSVDPERAAAALHSRSELEVLLSAVGLNADAARPRDRRVRGSGAEVRC